MPPEKKLPECKVFVPQWGYFECAICGKDEEEHLSYKQKVEEIMDR